jgi:hypothetical protein
MVGEFAARHVPDVQLQPGRQRVRRVGHGVAAPGTIAQDEFDILAGVVTEAVVGWQLQPQQHHVGGFFVHQVDPGRHFLIGKCTFAGDLARLQHHVAVRYAAAGQHHAGGFFLGGSAPCSGAHRGPRCRSSLCICMSRRRHPCSRRAGRCPGGCRRPAGSHRHRR